jgi:hypothetical protein
MSGLSKLRICLSCPLAWFVAGAAVLCLGCSSAEDYDMGQTIEMGPFAFQVVGAWATSPDDRHPEIFVDFRLLSDQSHGQIGFDDILNDMVDSEGNATAKMRLSPRTKVVDGHGHRFVGVVSDLSARYILFEVRLRDQDRFENEHFGMRPEDFRLVIKNPDRRKGQPRAASIQLR